MEQNTSVKLCECGCGEPAPLAKETRRSHGYVKGQPQRFVRGHQSRLLPPETRAKISAASGASAQQRGVAGTCAVRSCGEPREVLGLCREHYEVIQAKGTLATRGGPPWIVTNIPLGIKRCARCKQWKPLTEYRSSKGRGGGGWESYCVPCRTEYLQERRGAATPEQQARRREYNRRWRAANPEKVRQLELRRRVQRLGCTWERWQTLIAAQGGKCAICQIKPEDPLTLSIDHDHETGEIRGLLCGTCNGGLGMFKDDPQLMVSAAVYVVRARGGDAPCASPVAAFDSTP